MPDKRVSDDVLIPHQTSWKHDCGKGGEDNAEAVKWNSLDGVVQCHRCGEVFIARSLACTEIAQLKAQLEDRDALLLEEHERWGLAMARSSDLWQQFAAAEAKIERVKKIAEFYYKPH